MREIDSLPSVSIVVVGKNEEKNLGKCFRSIFAIDYPSDKLEVVYVDTGSSDRSIDVASKFNVKVAEEHSDFPTPGLARNRGIREAKNDVIHFVDGDMTVTKTYLKKAVSVLGKNNIACVIGRVREKNRDRNFLSKILSYPWRIRKVGFVDAPGAGGTFIKNALQEVGGYNPNILKGQETELGTRMRQRGYNIYMIDSSMGVHDYCFSNLLGFMTHLYVIGKSYGRVLMLQPMESYSDLTVRARSLLIQGVFFLILALVAFFAVNPILIVAFPLFIAIHVSVKYWNVYYTRRDWSALLYYLFMHLGKPIVFSGMMIFFAERFILGRYK